MAPKCTTMPEIDHEKNLKDIDDALMPKIDKESDIFMGHLFFDSDKYRSDLSTILCTAFKNNVPELIYFSCNHEIVNDKCIIYYMLTCEHMDMDKFISYTGYVVASLYVILNTYSLKITIENDYYQDIVVNVTKIYPGIDNKISFGDFLDFVTKLNALVTVFRVWIDAIANYKNQHNLE